MAFPDRLDAPARTAITSEGGAGASRTTQVVRHADGRLRRLVPEELEVLNGFARGFTDIAGITPAKRGFLMGNALVTGLVTAIGRALWQRTDLKGREIACETTAGSLSGTATCCQMGLPRLRSRRVSVCKDWGAPNTMRAKSGWRGLMRMLRSAGTTALGTLNSAVWAPCSHACPMD